LKYGDKIFDVLTSYGYLIPEDRKLIREIKANQMKNAIYDFFTDSSIKSEDLLLFYVGTIAAKRYRLYQKEEESKRRHSEVLIL
jgi:hypothetical protein